MLVCIICKFVSTKVGVPSLLIFLALGMLFGSDGLFRIPFDDAQIAEKICSFGLIFIMFYGGFDTNFHQAKPVAGKAALLSSLGVAVTMLVTGVFCHFVLRFEWMESFLIGAVISSTDAATVFSILRSKKLNLKNNTASLLEVESGSNDPFAYMLTAIVLTIMTTKAKIGYFVIMILQQVVVGALCGVAVAIAAGFLLRKAKFSHSGLDTIFLFAMALLSYALPTCIGGNGYLSVYLTGILLGNMKLDNKSPVIHFFDGINGIMQIVIFFLLGLLSFPSQMAAIFLPSIAIALFLTFVARPIAVFLILSPFRCPIRQQLLVSFAGLRGAASIVFAIFASVNAPQIQSNIFHIVFCVVLFSIALQGSFLPYVAKKLDMVDHKNNVLKTFNDYQSESMVQFIEVPAIAGHDWIGKHICEIVLPPETLIALILRKNRPLVPNGKTIVEQGDVLVLGAATFHDHQNLHLEEEEISENHPWCGKKISALQLPDPLLIVMLKRKEKVIIPKGKTVIYSGDLLVLYRQGKNVIPESDIKLPTTKL